MASTVGNTHINASASFGLVYWPQGPITIYKRGLAKKLGLHFDDGLQMAFIEAAYMPFTR